ncbi:MAG: hypothetical protein KatS3mg097_620 [Candidatus Parcubacteria bacterium]|nr:MAG: hypothetical protein KatS3mg097_620 [Candidatus Parcubacteria bacterium]
MAYKINKKKSLFVLIKNSLGIKFFRSLYFFIDNKSKDIYKNGSLSCAFYVSTILKIIGLINDIHSTVKSTVEDLEKSGWYQINTLKKGAIIVWGFGKDGHKHIGFYIGKGKCVSNVSNKKKPLIHTLKYKDKKIETIYFHNDLK